MVMKSVAQQGGGGGQNCTFIVNEMCIKNFLRVRNIWGGGGGLRWGKDI